MKLYRSLGDLPLGGRRRAVAIGTFDGVHLGHQEVIRRAVAEGRCRGINSMAVTFEPNPIAVLRPEIRPAVLTHLGLKSALIERLGVDELLVVPFDRAFSRIRAERFAEMLTAAPIGADVVVVGRNFRFGHGGAGTAPGLAKFGRARGLAVEVPEIVTTEDGKPISSTRVRRMVAHGQVDAIIPLLGRPHAVVGVVAPGDQRGRGLGFPTANVELPADTALPPRGVYAGRGVHEGGRFAAAINIGTSPTFPGADGRPLQLEAHLIDHPDQDLYGRTMRVDFLERLRDEERYDDVDDLVAQIHEDVERARHVAGVL